MWFGDWELQDQWPISAEGNLLNHSTVVTLVGEQETAGTKSIPYKDLIIFITLLEIVLAYL